MAENSILFRPETVKEFVTELFMSSGMSKDDADFHANALVQSNLWGIDSHGVMRAPAYFGRMLNGAINVKPDIKVTKGGLGLTVVDGDAGAGFIVGRAAMNRAIEQAKEFNIGAVGVTNSNHFGAGALYARLAAEQGMIGIAMTNVIPLIVSPGTGKPVVGNNPLAVAIPTYGDFPFSLDISFSKVAGGKLTLAMKKGEKIPTDWATDIDGKPTDDPAKAFKGYLQPMGEHKGIGLAQMVDIFSGVITGGIFSHMMSSMYAKPKDPSLTGHFMIAINIEAIMGKDEMKERMAEYLSYLKSIPSWEEGKEVMMPGEIEYRRETERRKNGMPLPKTTVEELNALKAEHNIKAELTPLA